jgi:hypothetical protein
MSIMEDHSGSKEADSSTAIVIDPAEELAVLRKLDRVILPLMAFVYFFQCTDQRIYAWLCPALF